MKITEITIENYKSIKQLTFKPNSGLNAFIGENSVGKSNIFDAIYWLLGPVYPSFNSTQDDEHYLGKPENKIKIKERIKNKQNLPSWVRDVVDKVTALKQKNVKSVLIDDQDQEEDASYESETEDALPF